jgi:hypothetical protein
MYKKSFSKTAKREFAEKMSEIQNYCDNNAINYSCSMDSFYFEIDGQKYRVSNHTVKASNAKAFNEFGEKIRELYHKDDEGYNCIFASKTRLIEIHKKLKSGITVNAKDN